jgi:putative transposase
MFSIVFDLTFKILVGWIRMLTTPLSQIETENLFLRYQLQVLRREVSTPPKLKPFVRAILSSLGFRLARLKESCFIVKPETLLAWHRRLVKWKWTYRNSAGRPPISAEIKTLIIKMKSENRLWGVPRIRGELLKLGIKLAESTIRKILRQNGFDPATHRPSLSWWEFIKRHKKAWACDFFTVETAFLQTLCKQNLSAVIDVGAWPFHKVSRSRDLQPRA